jgi:hypothetical protein
MPVAPPMPPLHHAQVGEVATIDLEGRHGRFERPCNVEVAGAGIHRHALRAKQAVDAALPIAPQRVMGQQAGARVAREDRDRVVVLAANQHPRTVGTHHHATGAREPGYAVHAIDIALQRQQVLAAGVVAVAARITGESHQRAVAETDAVHVLAIGDWWRCRQARAGR